MGVTEGYGTVDTDALREIVLQDTGIEHYIIVRLSNFLIAKVEFRFLKQSKRLKVLLNWNCGDNLYKLSPQFQSAIT